MGGHVARQECCPSCRRMLRVPVAFSGLLVQCRFCNAEFWLPKSTAGDYAFDCPGCSTALRIPRQFAGKNVECKSCNARFAAPQPESKTRKARQASVSDCQPTATGPEDTVIVRNREDSADDQVVL